MRARVAATAAVAAALVATTVACHRRDDVPPAPPVEHPATLQGRVFAVAGIDAHRAAIAYAIADGPIELALWQDNAPVWAVATACERVDRAEHPNDKRWQIGARFVAITAADDVVTASCPDPGDRVRRTTAFRTGDGTRAWVGEGRDESRDQRHELYALRAGGGVVVYDDATADLVDAATGTTLARFAHRERTLHAWRSPPRVVIQTWDATASDQVALLDATTGGVVARSAGVVACALPDAVLVVRGNDYVRIGLDGRETAMPAGAFTPHDAPCGTRGDRTIVLADVASGVRVTEISAAGVRGRSVLIPHAGSFDGEYGWEGPLPRFVAVATHRNRLAIVDVDDMRLVRTVFPGIDAPDRSALTQLDAGRAGDTWVSLAAFGLWGVDGATGQLVALRDEAIADPYWLDIPAAVAAPPWWVAREVGSAGTGSITATTLALSPAALTADSDVARALEAAAAGADND
jgi:hypothetical protein